MTNKREIGQTFESLIAKKLAPFGLKPTANSGARMNDGDLASRDWVIECKVKNQSLIGISEKELTHVQNQAKRDARDWALIFQNRRRETLVLIDFNTFEALLTYIRDIK